VSYRDLSEFLGRLESEGELVRIEPPVSRDLEITEIVDRVSKGPARSNRALLFESVIDSEIPVAINLFGSAKRMAWALGADDLDEISDRLASLLDFSLPAGIGGMVSRGSELLGALRSIGMGPSKVRSGPVQQVILEDGSLDMLPILTCWPEDGGRFITLPQVITHDPETGARNVGMYRLQVVDNRRLLMHWQRHKGGAEHERVARKSGTANIPAAIVLGGDPASMWAASAPLPPNIDEYLLAGWLRGSPVEFIDCVSQPLQVPANAEIVIEGFVDPTQHLPEGPFGDHTGYYTPMEPFPIFQATAITHRQDPIYPTTVVGIPPMEDVWMGKATERIFLPLMRLFLPEIVDVNMPAEGVFHNLVLISIRKRYPGHARKVIHGLWGLGLMMLAKTLVILDDWVDVQDLSQSAWQALGNVDWSQDVVITQGPVDHLDHASYSHSFGGKIGIDATAKLQEEGYGREWPKPLQMTQAVKDRITQIWDQLGL
jgi:4-hydroxy-3-polyprenylbenzoate decarboxylase